MKKTRQRPSSRAPAESERQHPAPAVAAIARLSRLDAAGLAVVMGLAVLMLTWIWARGCDVLVDFGREVYIPWQLTEGKVLYRDIAHLHGPISQYFNAIWFKLFGSSIACLALCNMAVVLVLIALLYRLLSVIAGRLAVFACLLWFVLVFAFADYCQNGGIGNNFNYIYPYVTEATHGIVLSFAAIACFWGWLERRQASFAVASGVLTGCVFLTKPEIFLALAGALFCGLLLASWLQDDWRERGQLWVRFIAGAAVPPVLSVLLLSLAMPISTAVEGTLGGFVHILNRQLSSMPFYRDLMGTLHFEENLKKIGFWLAMYAGLLVVSGLVAWRWRFSARAAYIVGGCAFVAIAAWGQRDFVSLWLHSLSPLPAIIILAIAAAGWRFYRGRAVDNLAARRIVLELTLLVFSLLLMLKVFFNAMAMWYGFTLVMPASLMLLVTVLDRIPVAIERAGGNSFIFRAMWLAPCFVFVYASLTFNKVEWLTKTAQVSQGVNKILTYPDQADSVNIALEQIAKHSTHGQTLAVIPEGTMINFLAKRANSTPILNFNPTEMMIFGEARMLAAVQANPPDFVLFHPQDVSTFGLQGFGTDYGRELATWMAEHYQPVEPPARVGKYPLVLAKRKSSD